MRRKVQIAIIGGGPSGLLLGQLLHQRGIDAIVLERRTKDYVLGRIRAGVLERGLVTLMDEAGVGDRLHREALVHHATNIAFPGGLFSVNFTDLTGHPVLVYGQTEVTRDLYAAREGAGAPTEFEVENVQIHGADGDAPYVTYRLHGDERRIDCDFVAGCDGFHGVSRKTIPGSDRTEYERVYPFGWLGLLSETPPVDEELIYASSEHGFALCSMRNLQLSRYYIQCDLSDWVEDWSDDRFWTELKRRIPADVANVLTTGASVEKSIAPLRSFVCAPMRWGRLFLCGDAAHIVPPTGAKGLNTAASDVHYLYHALTAFYQDGSTDGIDTYSDHALARIWKTQRFSWWFTGLMHRFPDQTPFDDQMQAAEIDFLRTSREAQAAMAINYVGLPY